VSVTRVVDPQDAPGAALTPGTRAVGVFVRLVNNGPATYDSSATGDVELVASEPVTPLYAPAGTCRTATVDFEMRIVPGEVRTGCVAFSVPSAARLVAVRFSPHGAATRRLVWWIPR
jgi:hypothetical protein